MTAVVGVACGGWLSARHPRSSAVLLVVSLSALGLSRVELVALMLPLFAAVGVLVWEQRRNWRWPVTLVGVPVLTVGLVHVGRRLYFGEWLPNTAVVQERSTGLWDIATILLIAGAFGAVLARGVVHRHVANPDLRRLAALACSASFLIFGAVLVWASATGRSGGPLDRLALFAPFLALAVIAALAFLVGRYLGQDDRMLNYVLVALVMVPIGQFLATGEARLDEFRVAGVAVAFLGLLICSLTRALLTAPDPTELVTAAVGECAADRLSPFRCQSVRRSIQRAAETLRRRGTLDDAVAALSASPSIELDRPMLERNAGWGSAAHSAFVHLADS